MTLPAITLCSCAVHVTSHMVTQCQGVCMGITSGIQSIDDSQFTQLIIHGFIQWGVTSHVVNECQGVWVLAIDLYIYTIS